MEEKDRQIWDCLDSRPTKSPRSAIARGIGKISSVFRNADTGRSDKLAPRGHLRGLACEIKGRGLVPGERSRRGDAQEGRCDEGSLPRRIRTERPPADRWLTLDRALRPLQRPVHTLSKMDLPRTDGADARISGAQARPGRNRRHNASPASYRAMASPSPVRSGSSSPPHRA